MVRQILTNLQQLAPLGSLAGRTCMLSKPSYPAQTGGRVETCLKKCETGGGGTTVVRTTSVALGFGNFWLTFPCCLETVTVVAYPSFVNSQVLRVNYSPQSRSNSRFKPSPLMQHSIARSLDHFQPTNSAKAEEDPEQWTATTRVPQTLELALCYRLYGYRACRESRWYYLCSRSKTSTVSGR